MRSGYGDYSTMPAWQYDILMDDLQMAINVNAAARSRFRIRVHGAAEKTRHRGFDPSTQIRLVSAERAHLRQECFDLHMMWSEVAINRGTYF